MRAAESVKPIINVTINADVIRQVVTVFTRIVKITEVSSYLETSAAIINLPCSRMRPKYFIN